MLFPRGAPINGFLTTKSLYEHLFGVNRTGRHAAKNRKKSLSADSESSAKTTKLPQNHHRTAKKLPNP
jgi:hypothetical protein